MFKKMPNGRAMDTKYEEEKRKKLERLGSEEKSVEFVSSRPSSSRQNPPQSSRQLAGPSRRDDDDDGYPTEDDIYCNLFVWDKSTNEEEGSFSTNLCWADKQQGKFANKINFVNKIPVDKLYQRLSVQRLAELLQMVEKMVPKIEPESYGNVVCSSVTDRGPEEFYLQWTSKDHQSGLKLLTFWLKSAVAASKKGDKPSLQLEHSLTIGIPVVVPYRVDPEYENMIWSRGTVKQVLRNDRVLVYLTDYGNEKIVPRRWVYKAPPELKKIKPFCFRAKLSYFEEDPDHRCEVKIFFMKCMAGAGEVQCIIGEDDDTKICAVTLTKIFSKTSQQFEIGSLVDDYMKALQM